MNLPAHRSTLIDAVEAGLCSVLVGTCDVSIVAHSRRVLSSHTPPPAEPPPSEPPPAAASSPPASPGAGCTETCSFASDGGCDDGGPGAEFASCSLGTDCTDCGPRVMPPPRPVQPPAPASPPLAPASTTVLLEAQRTYDYVTSASRTNLSVSTSDVIAGSMSSLGVTVNSVVLTALSATITVTEVGPVTESNLVDTLGGGAIAAGFAAQLPSLTLNVSALVTMAPPLPPPLRPPPSPAAPPPSPPPQGDFLAATIALAIILPLLFLGIATYVYLKLKRTSIKGVTFEYRTVRGTDRVLPAPQPAPTCPVDSEAGEFNVTLNRNTAGRLGISFAFKDGIVRLDQISDAHDAHDDRSQLRVGDIVLLLNGVVLDKSLTERGLGRLIANSGQQVILHVCRPNDVVDQATVVERVGTLDPQTSSTQKAIAAAGGIEALVALAVAGDAEGKANAAAALLNLLVDNAPNQAAITAAGGIEALVAIARDGDADGKMYAAAALRGLAHKNAANYAAIVAAGAEDVVALMDDDSQEVAPLSPRRRGHVQRELWELQRVMRVVDSGK